MKTGRAFGAGVVGGLAMTILTALARAMGVEVNLEMMQGTMLGMDPGMAAWLLGLVMHLVISGLIALLYVVGFERVARRGGWLSGIGFSGIHILVGGVVIGMVPMIHSLMPEVMPAPGAFLSNQGMMGVLVFFLLHVIYGAIVGGMYGRPSAEVASGADVYS